MLASSAIAQDNARRPQAILVDQIGGRSAQQPLNTRSGNIYKRAFSTEEASTERRTFDLMNAERQASGLQMIEWDDELAAVARMHSKNMAERKFFSHRGADGYTVDHRAALFGIRKWLAIGENIALIRGHDDPATVAVDNWMRSTAHKKNILNALWQRAAIGVVEAADGTIYFTQVFIAR